MLCPKCHHNATSVIDSRDIDTKAIRRRRECDRCRFRFTTHERYEPVKLTVLKRNGSTQPYDRQKITRSIKLACQKRSMCLAAIEAIVDRIESRLLEDSLSPVPTKKIGQMVIDELKNLDQVAYLRFASVFKEFKTLRSFSRELERLQEKS